MEGILEEVIGEIYDENDDGSVRRFSSASAALKNRAKEAHGVRSNLMTNFEN